MTCVGLSSSTIGFKAKTSIKRLDDLIFSQSFLKGK